MGGSSCNGDSLLLSFHSSLSHPSRRVTPSQQTEQMTQEIEDLLEMHTDTDLQVMVGFDDCIVGIVEQFGRPPIVCYDRNKVIQKMAEEQDSSFEDAEEFFLFNQLGAYVGESTPCFIHLPAKEEYETV